MRYRSLEVSIQIINSILNSCFRQILYSEQFNNKNYQSVKFSQFVYDETAKIRNMKTQNQKVISTINKLFKEEDAQPIENIVADQLKVKIQGFSKQKSKKTTRNLSSDNKSKKKFIKTNDNQKRDSSVSNISNTSSNTNKPLQQRKKYFSQYKRKPYNPFVKLKLNPKDEIQTSNQVEIIQDQMRGEKIIFQNLIKMKQFNHSKNNRMKKCMSLQADSFPLIQNINLIKVDIKDQRKCKKLKTNLNAINIQSQKTNKFFNLQQKSKMQIIRQKQTQEFFQKYHKGYDANMIKDQQKMLKKSSSIKIVDQIQEQRLQIQKRNQSVSRNKLSIQRNKSLTTLGGRNKRTSKVQLINNIKTNNKLPKLKLSMGNKQNTTEEIKRKESKVIINNKDSFNFMLFQQRIEKSFHSFNNQSLPKSIQRRQSVAKLYASTKKRPEISPLSFQTPKQIKKTLNIGPNSSKHYQLTIHSPPLQVITSKGNQQYSFSELQIMSKTQSQSQTVY